MLPESSFFGFAAHPDLHSYTFGVDPVTGITVYVRTLPDHLMLPTS